MLVKIQKSTEPSCAFIFRCIRSIRCDCSAEKRPGAIRAALVRIKTVAADLYTPALVSKTGISALVLIADQPVQFQSGTTSGIRRRFGIP